MIPAFAQDLARHGSHPALLTAAGRVVSFADLDAMVTEAAGRLAGPKALMLLEAAATPETIACHLGALRAGHAVALLPAGDAAAMAQAEARFSPGWVWTDGRLRVAPGRPAALHPDLCLLMLTSGSTGAGKAVRLSGAAVAANAAQIAQTLDLTETDRAALVLPLHYSYGLSVLHSHLSVGGSVWLHPGSVQRFGFGAAMAAAGCTTFAGVPHSYQLLEGAADLPPLRLMTVAGGRMAPEAVSRWAARQAGHGDTFAVMYGQTEATARMAVLPPALVADHPDSIGQPIPGGSFTLRDDKGREITRPGVTGELIYRGPNVMMGYAETADDLARGPEVTALVTGDLASRDAQGLYRITGRRARFSKIGGVRLGHDALEAALARHGIAAAVTGDDQAVTLWHEPAPGRDVERLAQAASGLGRRHLACVELAALPRMASGKIDYPALKARARPRASGIAQAMRDCFHPTPVGPHDTFETLAGDSLRHVEMVLALERALGHVPAGWERMTLTELQAEGITPQPARWSRLGTDTVLRALAILAVVVQHELDWPVWGGAAAMVLLMGWSLGRFSRAALVAGDWVRVFRPMGRVLGAYALVLATYALVNGQIPWVSVLLVGNFAVTEPETGLMLPYLYWFVEAWVQMMLLVAGAFLLPPVRRFAAARPFGFGLAFLALAEAIRFWGPGLLDLGGRNLFALPWVFWLCALGWCIATAKEVRQRWLTSGLILAACLGGVLWGHVWYGAWIKYSAVAAAGLLLLWLPGIALPGWLARGVVTVAQGAFLIYLTHRWVPLGLMPVLTPGLSGWPAHLLAIGGGIGLGLGLAAAERLLRRGMARLASRRARRHSPAIPL